VLRGGRRLVKLLTIPGAGIGRPVELFDDFGQFRQLHNHELGLYPSRIEPATPYDSREIPLGE
jgi:hypothetical protein